jgi:hypothetical protein
MAKPLIAVPLAYTLLAAGNNPGATPASNLALMQPGDMWQSSNLTSLYFEVDLGSAQAINLVALLFTNLTAAATWQVRGATSQANLTAAPGYNSGAISFRAETASAETRLHGYLFLSTAQNYRYWRVDLTDAANPATFVNAGRLVISSAWQSSRFQRKGEAITVTDTSKITRMTGGQAIPTPYPVLMGRDFTIPYLTEDEMYAQVYELARLRGTSKEALVIMDPAATTHQQKKMIYGLFASGVQISRPELKLFEQRFVVTPLL